MRRTSPWFIVALVCLVGSSIGIRSGVNEWGEASGTAQHLASLTELGYGVAGLAGAAALWVGHRKTLRLVAVWAIFVTATGGMAPVVWGGSPLYIGLLAGVISALIAAGVFWLAYHAIHQSPPAV
ncbi:MAG TPA: hypothetical protein VFU23_15180 [Gemmatimonadales bacterium]|nr:hypothetical protein [Gemmatimonadales bacterium]